MFRSLLRIRYLAAVVALVFAVHAAGFLALGLLRGYHAYALLSRPSAPAKKAAPASTSPSRSTRCCSRWSCSCSPSARPACSSPSTGDGRAENLPEWMRVKSLTELKLLLWEAILATLVVDRGERHHRRHASPRVEAPGAAAWRSWFFR